MGGTRRTNRHTRNDQDNLKRAEYPLLQPTGCGSTSRLRGNGRSGPFSRPDGPYFPIIRLTN